MKSTSVWPWTITAILVLYVLFLASFLLFSRTVPVNLVREDYYQQSVKYQDQIERLRRTAALPDKPSMTYTRERQTVVVRYPQALRTADLQGTVTLMRPADARKDVQVPLTLDGDGVQEITVADLGPGLWRANLAWRSGDVEYFHQEILTFSPTVMAGGSR